MSILAATGRFVRRAAGVAAVVSAGMVSTAAIAASQEGTSSIETLGWMAGCWETAPSGGDLYEEVWLAPRGGVMLGVSRTLRDGEAVAHDFPQTIRYRSETPGVLLARIEGERQGETRGVDFPLRRARCPR